MHDERKNTVAFWREAARRLGMGGSEHTVSVDDLDDIVVMLSQACTAADRLDGSAVPIMTRLFVTLDPELCNLLFDYAEGALGPDEAQLVEELMACLPGTQETVEFFRRTSSAGDNEEMLDLIENWGLRQIARRQPGPSAHPPKRTQDQALELTSTAAERQGPDR